MSFFRPFVEDDSPSQEAAAPQLRLKLAGEMSVSLTDRSKERFSTSIADAISDVGNFRPHKPRHIWVTSIALSSGELARELSPIRRTKSMRALFGLEIVSTKLRFIYQDGDDKGGEKAAHYAIFHLKSFTRVHYTPASSSTHAVFILEIQQAEDTAATYLREKGDDVEPCHFDEDIDSITLTSDSQAAEALCSAFTSRSLNVHCLSKLFVRDTNQETHSEHGTDHFNDSAWPKTSIAEEDMVMLAASQVDRMPSQEHGDIDLAVWSHSNEQMDRESETEREKEHVPGSEKYGGPSGEAQHEESVIAGDSSEIRALPSIVALEAAASAISAVDRRHDPRAAADQHIHGSRGQVCDREVISPRRVYAGTAAPTSNRIVVPHSGISTGSSTKFVSRRPSPQTPEGAKQQASKLSQPSIIDLPQKLNVTGPEVPVTVGHKPKDSIDNGSAVEVVLTSSTSLSSLSDPPSSEAQIPTEKAQPKALSLQPVEQQSPSRAHHVSSPLVPNKTVRNLEMTNVAVRPEQKQVKSASRQNLRHEATQRTSSFLSDDDRDDGVEKPLLGKARRKRPKAMPAQKTNRLKFPLRSSEHQVTNFQTRGQDPEEVTFDEPDAPLPAHEDGLAQVLGDTRSTPKTATKQAQLPVTIFEREDDQNVLAVKNSSQPTKKRRISSRVRKSVPAWVTPARKKQLEERMHETYEPSLHDEVRSTGQSSSNGSDVLRRRRRNVPNTPPQSLGSVDAGEVES